MSTKAMISESDSSVLHVHLDTLDAESLQRLCGPGNRILQRVEQFFGVRLLGQPGNWTVEGERAGAASDAIRRLAGKVLRLEDMRVRHPGTESELSELDVEGMLRDVNEDQAKGQSTVEEAVEKGHEHRGSADDSGEAGALIAGRRHIRGKTSNQRKYLQAIQTNTLTLAIGPAGSGKTYLAVAAAVAAMNSNRAERIILTRPAVEAGERLGFLPGDMQQKVDPYLRPLFDALADMLGVDKMNALLEQGRIEIAPLAYMRGRTLNDAFVILDEAQNTTQEQMKMFLTRLGFGATMVVTGDVTQVDLPKHQQSGLLHALQVLEDVKDIAVCRLTSGDVVRHRLVEAIVNAYEEKTARD